MKIRKAFLAAFLLSMILLASAWKGTAADEIQLPAFGRDTVLVWKIQNANFGWDFVVRIAEFLPDRFLEWEEMPSQGTTFMSSQDVREAKGFVNSQLFEPGVDTRSKNVTTLWLSQKIYREFKEKKKIKMNLDGVPGWMTLEGTDQFTVEVNKSKVSLPVIKVKDDRGAERWFLDLEENALLIRHLVKQYDQSLVSITTNKSNTLRFIKGSKLNNLPR
jgi:hypothetical protein